MHESRIQKGVQRTMPPSSVVLLSSSSSSSSSSSISGFLGHGNSIGRGTFLALSLTFRMYGSYRYWNNITSVSRAGKTNFVQVMVLLQSHLCIWIVNFHWNPCSITSAVASTSIPTATSTFNFFHSIFPVSRQIVTLFLDIL